MSASATVVIRVAIAPNMAFDLFTREIGQWWRRGPATSFRPANPGRLEFESGPGGRLLECYDDTDHVYEVGKILDWQPGKRLSFEWIGINFAPGEKTEVEVLFQAVDEGTRIVLTHSGWDGLPRDHPARHGLSEQAHLTMLATWWRQLLGGYAARTQAGIA